MEKQTCRMVKWKKYRMEIQKNISLQESIKTSNEKLNILSDRLISIFPEYELKYPIEKEEKLVEINLNDTSGPKLFSIDQASEIIDKINENESNEHQSLQYIELFSFSSGELDSVIDEVRVGKVAKLKYVNMEDESEAQMEFQKVELPKGVK